jgi:hypothetical protein
MHINFQNTSSARTLAQFFLAINHRRSEAVARESERLVRDGVPVVDLPEVEQVELDASISEVAFAEP